MAAKRSSPEHIEAWVARVSGSRTELEVARSKADEAYASFCTEIRSALSDGVTAKDLHDATGLTPSRLFQIKAGRRT